MKASEEVKNEMAAGRQRDKFCIRRGGTTIGRNSTMPVSKTRAKAKNRPMTPPKAKLSPEATMMVGHSCDGSAVLLVLFDEKDNQIGSIPIRVDQVDRCIEEVEEERELALAHLEEDRDAATCH